MEKRILIFILVLFLVTLFIIPANAQEDMEERLQLIRASQDLEQTQLEENSTQRHKFGVTLSNFGSESNMLNPGLRLENKLIDDGFLRLVTELYYLRETEDIASFISLSFRPISFGYLGLGAEVSGKADYQIFTGLNLTENIFVEIKGINDGGSFKDSDLYFATGFMIGF